MANSVMAAKQERGLGAKAQVAAVAVAAAAAEPGADAEPARAAEPRLGEFVAREHELDVPEEVEAGVVLDPLAQAQPRCAAGQEVVVAGERQRAERDPELELPI